jgi:serine/threonine-protein kinase
MLWHQGQQPDVEEFLAREGVRDTEEIVAVLRVDQWERARQGQDVRAEAYLETFPVVRDDPEQAIDLIFAEFLLHEDWGERPAIEEYIRRFPPYAEELKLQLALHQAMETAPSVVSRRAQSTAILGPGSQVEFHAESGGFPRIPGYEILGVLGRGGMGVVYRAWQQELNRPVAIKMVRGGADADPQLLGRFRVEAEAVARLRHPNIVQIHDVVQHAGTPFLVLELVEGTSLAQRLAGTPQPARESAELVEALARTIDSAHRHGVVHRDLTPANILVTADGVPKITDFGLAKLIIGGGDLRTQTGELLGTPSYMAPEQAASRHQMIGAATDIYALGAILYELLCGRPPFRAESPLETMRQVLSDEPIAPSRLRPRLPADLETICLKCLRKEPAQRYPDALEVADDLRRFLDGRPILARRTSTLEWAWRWCKRNRVVAALLAVVLGLTVALAVGSTAAALRLKRSRDEARLQRNLAEANLREARQAVDDSFTKVSESVLLHTPGLQPLRKQLLEDALRYYQGFVGRLTDQPDLQAELAAALDRVARITSEIGSREEALGYHRRARGIYSALLAARPDDVPIRRALARSIAAIALVLDETGRREESVLHYQQALAIQQALVAADPDDVQARNDLADSESGLGLVLKPLARTEEARRCFERALAIRERLTEAAPDTPRFRSELARDYVYIARGHHDAGRYDEAIRSYRSAITIQARLVAAHAEAASYRSSLAISYTLLGVSQRAAGRRDEALESYQDARKAQEALVAANPSVTVYRYDLAATCNDIANLQRASGQLEEALVTHRRALEIGEGLVASDPRVVRYQSSMAGSSNAIAMIQTELGRPAESLRTLEEFGGRMQAVLGVDPKNTDARFWLSSSWHNRGMVLLRLGRPAEAVVAIRQAIEQKRRVLAEGPRSKGRLRSLSNHYLELARAESTLGRGAEAATTLWENRETWAGNADGLYNLACGLALCIPIGVEPSPELGEQSRKNGDRAMDVLRRAVDAGFRDLAHIRKDGDLVALRSRDDFQALLGNPAVPDDPFAPAD